MSRTKTSNPAARAARPPAPARTAGAGRPGRQVSAGGPRAWLRRRAGLAVTLAGTVLLAAACGGSSPGPAASALYQRSLAYSRCMRSHGVPDFPILKQGGPGGTLVHPVSPPAGMLTSPDYDAAFRTCLKLAVVGGHQAAHYRATALHGLMQAEFAPRGLEHHIAPLVDSHFLATIDGEPDGPRVRAGRNHEVVFQLPLIAVVNQVDAGIDIRVPYFRVVRHIRAPLCRIIADEIVTLAG